LADSGYADKEGYMVPFQGNRLHLDHFKGVDLGTLGKEENFQLPSCEPPEHNRKEVRKPEREVENIGRGAIHASKEASYNDNCVLCYGQLFVATTLWNG
jgi:hypothetical protein